MPISRIQHDHELSPETMEFLKELRKQDIEDIKDTIIFYHTLKGVSKTFKWLIITVIGSLLALTTFWNHLTELKDLFFGHK